MDFGHATDKQSMSPNRLPGSLQNTEPAGNYKGLRR